MPPQFDLHTNTDKTYCFKHVDVYFFNTQNITVICSQELTILCISKSDPKVWQRFICVFQERGTALTCRLYIYWLSPGACFPWLLKPPCS